MRCLYKQGLFLRWDGQRDLVKLVFYGVFATRIAMLQKWVFRLHRWISQHVSTCERFISEWFPVAAGVWLMDTHGWFLTPLQVSWTWDSALSTDASPQSCAIWSVANGRSLWFCTKIPRFPTRTHNMFVFFFFFSMINFDPFSQWPLDFGLGDCRTYR